MMSEMFLKHFPKRLNCDSEKLLPIVYLFISATLDYAVWEDEAKIEHELKAIYVFLDILPKQG